MIRLNKILYNLPKVKLNKNFKYNKIKKINLKYSLNEKINLKYSLNKILNKQIKINNIYNFNKQVPINLNVHKLNKIPKQYINNINKQEYITTTILKNKENNKSNLRGGKLYFFTMFLILILYIIKNKEHSIIIQLIS